MVQGATHGMQREQHVATNVSKVIVSQLTFLLDLWHNVVGGQVMCWHVSHTFPIFKRNWHVVNYNWLTYLINREIQIKYWRIFFLLIFSLQNIFSIISFNLYLWFKIRENLWIRLDEIYWKRNSRLAIGEWTRWLKKRARIFIWSEN